MDTNNEVTDVKKQISELIEQLPPMEQSVYEAFLLGLEIKEELSVLLKQNDGTSSDLQLEIDRTRKKMVALEDLMKINETLKKLYNDMIDDHRQVLNVKGAGIRKVINDKKNKDLNARQSERNSARATTTVPASEQSGQDAGTAHEGTNSPSEHI